MIWCISQIQVLWFKQFKCYNSKDGPFLLVALWSIKFRGRDTTETLWTCPLVSMERGARYISLPQQPAGAVRHITHVHTDTHRFPLLSFSVRQTYTTVCFTLTSLPSLAVRILLSLLWNWVCGCRGFNWRWHFFIKAQRSMTGGAETRPLCCRTPFIIHTGLSEGGENIPLKKL